MTAEDWEKTREIVNEAMRTTNPPPNCELKEISPNMFAWVKCTDDDDDGEGEDEDV